MSQNDAPGAPTARTKLGRAPQRGHFDRETILAILDEALICHVGFVVDGAPRVIPTAHWVSGGRLYIHGATKAGFAKALTGGAEACVTVTLLDGLVMARSAFHHSVNYRSVILYGRPHEVTDPAEKTEAFRHFLERVAPGRWDTLRPIQDKEVKATTVLAFDLDEASAKIRSGPPIDDEEDYALPIWAGVIPVTTRTGAPQDDPRLAEGLTPPEHLRLGTYP